jgi:hypothetical protein
MTITAQIIADSISPDDIRITSFQLRYPRFIHSELMTHRVFSRNASSSRAVPVAKLIADIRRDPAMPIAWGKNQKGMQAREELPPEDAQRTKDLWSFALDQALYAASKMAAQGAHKQIVNRILEPFAHINVILTATEFENFFALRRHPDAQPEIRALADAMWTARQVSRPVYREPGDWHLPYVDGLERFRLDLQSALRVSTARCARVSYLTHDGRETSLEEDLALYERLVGTKPIHASPAEHQATPDVKTFSIWAHPELQGNFNGWIQFRKTLVDEHVFA